MTAIKRCCALALAVLMILTALPVTAFAQAAEQEVNASLQETTVSGIANDITRQVLRSGQKNGEKIQMESTAKLDDSDEVEIIVVVNDSVADPDSRAQVNALLRTQKSALAQINRAIDGQVEPQWQYTTLLNGFSATVTYGQYKAIRKLDCVQSAFISPTFELLPDTANSNRMIGGGIYNTTGFTGEGMLVAILDTGVDMGHEIFKTAPKSPSLTREKLQSMLETYDFQVESIVKGISVSDLYYSAKIPFQFDYGDRDKDGMPGDKGSHGTHVASTAAGNTGVNEAAMGVAPQAQIINMNVFKSTGGASYADILAALEDCILLGVDVANLSLGSDCGYIDYDSEDAFTKSLLDVFERTGESGVSLAVAAGNAYNAAYGDAFGGKALASNPDYGLVSEPSTYGESLSVAAVSNGMVKGPYVTVGGKNLAYQDSATISEDENAKPFRSLSARGSIEYVVVPNYGAEEDYAGLDLTGKIALVQRGGGMYYEQKERNAANAGAIGMLVYNNVPGMLYMSITDWKIPCAFISQAAGEYMKQQETKTLSVASADALVESPTYGMADFSSWGATPELTLKPELTAPGAGIYAAVPGGYESMDGTSMASPHAAGGMAIVQQALKARDNSMTGAQRKHMTDTLLMSTAHVIYDDNGVPYSPRKQGAGLMSINDAVNTRGYLSVEGMERPKLELKDDPAMKGVYTMNFTVHNTGSDTLYYDVTPLVLTDTTEAYVNGSGQEFSTISGSSRLLPHTFTTNCENNRVAVAPGKTADVTVTVTVTDEGRAMLAQFPNGSYVEGFVILTAADGSAPQIGMPLLAFLGDWTSAPILDRANWFDEPQDGENVMNNDCTLGVNVVGSTIRSAGEVVNFLNLGQNIFDTDIAAESKQTVFHQENFAISPDGSGYFDAIDDLELYQLRDAKLFVTEVRNKNTNELYFRTFNTYVPRSVYQAGYGVVLPMSLYYFTDAWDGTDLNGDVLPNGTQCVYTITAYGEGDYGDTVDNEELGRPVTDFESFVDGKEPTFNGHKMDKTGDVLSFDVLVDTQAPKLENNAVTFYQKDGRTYMQGTVYDEDGSLASVAVHAQVSRTYTDSTGREITEYNIDLLNPLYSQSIYDADTHTFTFTADVTEYRGSYNWTGNVYLSCGDYAANDRTYAIKVDASQGLTLSQTSARLHPGQSFDLSVNNNTGSTAPITRTSSNPEVATVDEFGHVVAVAPGQAIITVSNGTYSALCVIAVEASSTEVKDFKLSMDHFSGLKPNGAITVRVVDLQPADVEIYQNQWLVYEDDEDWAGLVSVSQNSSDALEGLIDLNYQASADKIPSGTGHLDVTINGVTRTMTFDWEDVYQTSDQEDLQSDAYYNEQTYYVTAGETASLIARYRQTHSFSDVKLYTAQGYVSGGSDNPTTAATGLVLDGPDFVLSGSEPWRGRLVNTEGYALPESIHVVYRYDYGYEYELTENAMYNGYTYDRTTGDIVVSAPYGSSTTVVIRADGTEKAGNPAGALSGVTYDRPDSTYGPFNWTVTEGGGKLETAEDVNVNGTRKNVAYYTPSEPGVSYLTATTKDGQYHVNFAVVCLPVQANTLRLDDTRATLHPLETLALNATLTPTPTRAEDAALTWTSFNPEVATVDENGVVTAHKPGYAYIKVSTDINTSVTAYCVVEVLPGQGYTVTLDANGGMVKPDSVSVQYGIAVGQLPVPVREGYTFDGWYDENGAQYTEDTIYAIAGDATLTARWTANIYEITLDANGGVTDVALVQVTFGQAVGALPTPTREGYVFLGWFDEVGSRYDASTVYSTADGVTLTARWGQEDSTFTITLNANGGKVEPSALAVVYGQAVGTLPVPTREGYTFGGWYDKDGNRYDASSVYSVKGDTTLTARWIENSVQTGDGFPIFLLSGAMMAAAAGAVMLLLKRRKLMGE